MSTERTLNSKKSILRKSNAEFLKENKENILISNFDFDTLKTVSDSTVQMRVGKLRGTLDDDQIFTKRENFLKEFEKVKRPVGKKKRKNSENKFPVLGKKLNDSLTQFFLLDDTFVEGDSSNSEGFYR